MHRSAIVSSAIPATSRLATLAAAAAVLLLISMLPVATSHAQPGPGTDQQLLQNQELGVSILLPPGYRQADQQRLVFTPGGQTQIDRSIQMQFIPAPGGNNRAVDLAQLLLNVIQQNAAQLPDTRVTSNDKFPVAVGEVQMLKGSFDRATRTLILVVACPQRNTQALWLFIYTAGNEGARAEEAAVMNSIRSMNLNVTAQQPGPGPGTDQPRYRSDDFKYSMQLPPDYGRHATQQQNVEAFFPGDGTAERMMFFSIPFAPAAQTGVTTIDEYVVWWVADQKRRLPTFDEQQRGSITCRSGDLKFVVFQAQFQLANQGTQTWRILHAMIKVGDNVLMWSCQSVAANFDSRRNMFMQALASIELGAGTANPDPGPGPGPGPGVEPDPVPVSGDGSARELEVAISPGLDAWATFGGRVLQRFAPGAQLKLVASTGAIPAVEALGNGGATAALVKTTQSEGAFNQAVNSAAPGARVIPVGTRALAVIAAAGCPVSRVTMASLKALITGAADAPKTFGDLDAEACAGTPWATRKLRLLLPPAHSPGSAWVSEWLNNGGKLAASLERASSDMQLATAARSDNTVLAIADAGWVGSGTMALPVASESSTGAPAAPTADNVMSGTYPLSARLLVVLPARPSDDALALAHALLDSRGQAFAGDPNRNWAPLTADQMQRAREALNR